ncbi:hypothetical protein [Nonomuraea jiangxiensis]|uniref:Uncharacterized protein n=1 Tax=Nonomuraea jiangxiensis TaxID=633440 RepID=A0A1G8LRN6_9ACTN|nr:hypothetical protein [Nonomuraea jiangxiensis]SDI57850.1 hypothetical protein SAMN05421869_106167 [Nonomuraea jiangxiensis]
MINEAVRNNAEWCDLMCRTHGIPGTFTDLAWTNPTRTPPLYPDAVTLSPAASAADVLDRIDPGSGASVKDSFATLDLPGFDVLFEATWIHHPAPGGTPRPAATGDPIAWEVVEDAATLREWEEACFSGGVRDLFLPGLLGAASPLCGRIEGDIVCGAMLNASGRVVGVSNVYASGCDIDAAWSGTVALAAELFPGRPLVGYESDPEPATKQGFTPIGPLRIWLRP